jgi:protein AroM
VEIREAGALDGLSKEEIAKLAPAEGDYVLVTRLADGSSVQVAEHFRNGIPLVFLLCTGEFPGFETGGLLIRPQKVWYQAAVQGRICYGSRHKNNI